MIYKFRASIPGSKVFMREYEVEGGSTLYEFNRFLVNDLGFSPDQMVLFKGIDNSGKERSEYGLFDMGDGSMDEVTVERVVTRRKEVELHYLFDLRRSSYIRLDFIELLQEQPRASYPRLVAEKGRNPEQFSKSYEDFGQTGDSFDENMEGVDIDTDELSGMEEKEPL